MKDEAGAVEYDKSRTDAERLDFIEGRLRTTGEVFFVRAFDGDMQMNTACAVGAGAGCTLRDLIDSEMKESERG